jgi:hypothetical protein
MANNSYRSKSASDLDRDLTTVLAYSLESKETTIEELVTSTTNLLNYCPASRSTILHLYGNIFSDLALVYIQEQVALKLINDGKVSTSRIQFGKFLSLLKRSPITGSRSKSQGIEIQRLSSERRLSRSTSESSEAKETPASPPPMVSSDEDDTAMVLDGDREEEEYRQEIVKSLMERISLSLLHLTSHTETQVQTLITCWAIDRLCSISTLLTPIAPLSTSEGVESLKELISFWTSCSVNSLLMKIILRSLENKSFDLKQVLLSIINFKTDETDNVARIEWICCSLISSVSDLTEMSSCVKFLLDSSIPDSVTEAVISFLSSENPEAIINCSKNNMTFLLRLCSKSKPLLDVFSKEVTKGSVDIQLLNRMQSLSLSSDHELKGHLIECLLLADNSFELLMIIVDVCVHRDSSSHVKQQSLTLLKTIVSEVQDFVYTSRNRKMSVFMNHLRDNYRHLITTPVFRTNKSLREIQRKLLLLLCIHSGFDFTVKIVHFMFNSCSPWDRLVTVDNFRSISGNGQLASLLSSISLAFSTEMKELPHRMLSLVDEKCDKFWLNLYPFSKKSFNVNVEDLEEFLTEKLHQEMYLIEPKSASINPITVILEIIDDSLKKDPKSSYHLKHNLCVSLVIYYVFLVEKLEVLKNEDELAFTEINQIMTSLSICQSIMKTLSSNWCHGSVNHCNQQLLTWTFFDCLLNWNKELEDEQKPKDKKMNTISLMEQNNSYSQSFKFRKMPLNPNKDFISWKNRANKKPLLTNYLSRKLILDGVKSCVQDMHLFSKLMVEVITPDVMFNDMIWPDEDFLKGTIERDIFISKVYDRNPILWDLTEMVSVHGSLNSCAVLVRAIMAVQLTGWASGTSSQIPDRDSLESTQKLLTLLAKSDMIPNHPFKYIPSVISSFTSWEIFCVLNDIWRLLRDTAVSKVTKGSPPQITNYLDRLRIIMSTKDPGPNFVNIFKIFLQR